MKKHSKTAIVFLVISLGIVFQFVDWSFWYRYLNQPENVITDVSWYSPIVNIGSGQGSPLSYASEGARRINEEQLEDFVRYARDKETYGLIVAQGGEIQIEWYAEGFDAQHVFGTQSLTRPLAVMLIGIAVAEGAIASIEEPVGTYIEEWSQTPQGAITIRDLLYMESGLKQEKFAPSPFAVAVKAMMSSNLRKVTLSLEQEFEPGSLFDFHFLTTQILSLILEKATGQQYEHYLKEKIWDKIGGGEANIRLDRQNGTANAFCCLNTTVLNWYRIGQLLLQEGRWQAVQVIPADWVQKMQTPSLYPQFGMHIWKGKPFSGERRFSQVRQDAVLPVSTPFIADDIYFLEGRGGQRVYVIPSLDTVVVRVGAVRYDWDDSIFMNHLMKIAVAKGKNESDPDYTNPDSWLSLHESKADTESPKTPAVFYIHPTTYRSNENWNEPIRESRENKVTQKTALEQASVFFDCCEVFAPFYRQAGISAVYDRTGKGAQAYDFAFEDVNRAFTYFLSEIEDRPFIIAGHSQGALHTLRLLERRVGETQRSRLIAAYVVGNAVPEVLYDTALDGFQACRGDSDTGCVLSWNAFGENADTSRFRTGIAQRFASVLPPEQDPNIQCNNPINWESKVRSLDKSDHLGGMFVNAELNFIETPAGEIQAVCRDGLLMVGTPIPKAFAGYRLPGDSLHLAEFVLFHKNISDNAVARAESYAGKNGEASPSESAAIQ